MPNDICWIVLASELAALIAPGGMSTYVSALNAPNCTERNSR